jgi:hypothetical protein
MNRRTVHNADRRKQPGRQDYIKAGKVRVTVVAAARWHLLLETGGWLLRGHRTLAV